MADDIDKAIKDNLNFTMELAETIILAAGEDPHDAFIKAVGTLAQVIYIITPDEHWAQALKDAMRSLKMYLKAIGCGGRSELACLTAALTVTPRCIPWLSSWG